MVFETFFGKKYKLEASDNFDAYMKALGELFEEIRENINRALVFIKRRYVFTAVITQYL